MEAQFLECESGYHSLCMDRCVWFEYAACGMENLWIRKEKVADQKIFENACRGACQILATKFCIDLETLQRPL